ncbi:MAG: arginine--tRNA ligase, partial [Treponema sp.]|nr:arginine--tRNA ligase [Treponema sp.]
MADVKEQIRAALPAALNQFKKEKNIDAPDVEAASLTLENPPDPKMGDVGVPLFAFAKTFRMGPPQISAGVAQILKGADEIGGVKVAGLGEILNLGPYINFKL